MKWKRTYIGWSHYSYRSPERVSGNLTSHFHGGIAICFILQPLTSGKSWEKLCSGCCRANQHRSEDGAGQGCSPLSSPPFPIRLSAQTPHKLNKYLMENEWMKTWNDQMPRSLSCQIRIFKWQGPPVCVLCFKEKAQIWAQPSLNDAHILI